MGILGGGWKPGEDEELISGNISDKFKPDVLPPVILPPYVPGWSGRGTPTARAPQELHFSGSAKGWAIPYVYGTRKVSGQIIGVDTVSDRWLYIVYLLCEGEVSSISSIKLNDVAIASAPGYSDHTAHVGAAAQTIDSTLNSVFTDWSDTHDNGLVAVTGRSTGRAYVWVKLDLLAARSPGVPTLTAEVTRGSVDDWSSTSRASTNPVVALWGYLTIRTGLASADIDATSWETCRTTCAADPGDGTAQWSVNLALTGSSDGACVQQLLQLFFGSLSWYDGKLYLSMRRTLSSATLTITEDHIIKPLTWSRTPLHQRPNLVDVIYTDDTSWQQQLKTSAGSGINRNSTDCRAAQIHLPGCTDPSMATRYAEQHRKLLTNEVINAQLSITSVGVELNPGDRVDITTPTGFTAEKFRVNAITALSNGEFGLSVTAYDSTAQSSATGSADTPPSSDIPPTAPAAPTGIDWSGSYFTYTDEFGNEESRGSQGVEWAHGTGGLPVVAWAFEAYDSTDPDPPSTIVRSTDVLYSGEATSCTWSISAGYGADFAKASPSGFVSYDNVRVIAISADGAEAASAWCDDTSMSSASPQNAGTMCLDDLVGVDTSGKSDGDHLYWDNGNSKWEAEAPGGDAPTTLEVFDDSTTLTVSGPGVNTKIVDESGVWRIDYVKGPNGTHDLQIKVDGSHVWGENPPAAPYGKAANYEYVGPSGDIIAPIYCSTGFEVWLIAGSGISAHVKAVKLGT